MIVASALKISVNSGDHDMVVPYVGTLAWIESLNLTVDSRWRPWFVSGQIAGLVLHFRLRHNLCSPVHTEFNYKFRLQLSHAYHI